MLFRFCIYGFLKNQQYYDPFIILAFREKGLSFFTIGLLVSFRHVCINIMEIPTGIIADIWGRRRSMILSFLAYITSFVIYGFSRNLALLFMATFFFGIGEAFRTGTHKAMIFTWLQRQGKEKEKTLYYGVTRSWSQVGSAVSVVIATIIVLVTRKYVWIFWISIIPYILNIFNFLGYPAYLDGTRQEHLSFKKVFVELFSVLFRSFRTPKLRNLFIESMVFKGSYTVSKEYLQPLLKSLALGLPVLLMLSGAQRSAIVVGTVYFILYLLSSQASRAAHNLSVKAGGVNRASVLLWRGQFLSFLIMVPFLITGHHLPAVICFVGISLMQNTFRPLLFSRLDECAEAELGATILSIDSQCESAFVLITAPLIGLAADHLGLWPVAVFGATLAAIIMLLNGRPSHPAGTPPSKRELTPEIAGESRV